MTHEILIWTLALMVSAPLSTAGGEPEDPYQWLEDVSGAKSLAWVKERNTESTNELTRSAEFQALDQPHPRDPRFRRSHPDRPEARPSLL